MQHPIGQRKDTQQHREQDWHLHIFGHGGLTERLGHAPTGQEAQNRRHNQTEDQFLNRLARGCGRLQDADHLKRQNGGKGTDGVVDDRLPLQQLRGTAFQAGLSQQGRNHGRPRYDHDPAKDRCTAPIQTGHIMQGQRGQQPPKGRTDKHQPPHTDGGVAQTVTVQGQAALKQDNRHGNRDHGLHQWPYIAGGIEHTGDGANDDPRQQHQNNRRKAQPPR